jgi:hypothetical protein
METIIKQYFKDVQINDKKDESQQDQNALIQKMQE